jgi:hypothetical protein
MIVIDYLHFLEIVVSVLGVNDKAVTANGFFAIIAVIT